MFGLLHRHRCIHRKPPRKKAWALGLATVIGLTAACGVGPEERGEHASAATTTVDEFFMVGSAIHYRAYSSYCHVPTMDVYKQLRNTFSVDSNNSTSTIHDDVQILSALPAGYTNDGVCNFPVGPFFKSGDTTTIYYGYGAKYCHLTTMTQFSLLTGRPQSDPGFIPTASSSGLSYSGLCVDPGSGGGTSNCHTEAVGGWAYCSSSCPCNSGEGDCDSDADCKSGLVCKHDVGANYGWSSTLDVCEEAGVTVADGALYVSQSGVPTTMTAGQKATVTLTFKNNGTSSWTSSYRLASQNPAFNNTWGVSTVDVGSTTSPGAQKSFSFTITAPATAGSYPFTFQMANGTRFFGAASPTRTIQVQSAPTSCHTEAVGGWAYCSSSCPCDAGEGDCDSDSQCKSGLVCRHNVGANYGWDPSLDVCEAATPSATDNAQFVSQSGVLTTMTAGQQATVTLTFKNSGTSSWGSGYALASQSPANNSTWGLSSVALSGSVAPGAQKSFTFTITAPATTGSYTFQFQLKNGSTFFGAKSPAVTVQVSGGGSSGGSGGGDGDVFNASDLTKHRDLFGSFSDSVDPFSGELRINHTDLVVPGPAGLDLRVTRWFRSHTLRQGINALGVGWHLHFGRLAGAYDDASFCKGGEMTRSFVLPGGHQMRFSRLSGTEYQSNDNWRGRCEGGQSVVYSPAGLRYLLGTKIYANHEEYATSEIRDLNGNWLKFSYLASTAQPCDPRDGCKTYPVLLPTEISASDGRRVTFTHQDGYDSSYRGVKVVKTMTAHDTSGASRVWSFGYHWTNYWVPHLNKVTRPDGRYYSFPSCSGLYDSCTAKMEIRQPEGGTTRYDFITSVVGAQGWGIVSKKVKAGGTWTFSYGGTSLPGSGMTTISGPDKRVEYDFHNAVVEGQAWLHGRLEEKRIKSTSGTLLQRETFSWDKRQLSSRRLYIYPFPWSQRVGTRQYSDPVTYAAMLKRRVITRDGSSYTSGYSNFDGYGNPQRIDESGQASRTTTLTYFNAISLASSYATWIVGKLDDQTVGGFAAYRRSFDSRGRLSSISRFGVTTTLGYHPNGDVAWSRDALGRTTYYNNYYRGQPRSIQRPGGTSVSQAINASGTIASVTNARGYTTSYSYDGLNRKTFVNFPQYSDSTISYGSTTKTTRRGGLTKTETVDGYGRLVRIDSAGSGQTIRKSFSYDPAGRKTFVSQPYYVGQAKRGDTISYDALGRVTKVTHADGTYKRTSFLSGNRVQITDERGKVTSESYRSYGDPDKRQLISIGSPEGISTRYSRNAVGTVTAVTQAGVTRTRTPDSKQRLWKSYDPEVGWTIFSYDAVGNLRYEDAPAGRTEHRYDDLDRKTYSGYPDGSSESFGYDKSGNLTSASNSTAQRILRYDALDQLSSDELRVDGRSFKLTHVRDGAGAIYQLIYPSGQRVTYSPDAHGRATQASPLVSGVQHYASGNLKSYSGFNGATTTVGEDSRLRVTSIKVTAPGGTVTDLRYSGYDGQGNPSSVRDYVYPTRDRSAISYDGVSRIKQVTLGRYPGYPLTFSYDNRGNLTRAEFVGSGAARDTPVSSSQRLLGVSYDARGNMASIGSGFAGVDPMTMRFDHRSRLRSATRSGRTVTFDYDATGRLVRQRANGATSYLAYDGSFQLRGQYTSSGQVIREKFWLAGQLIGGSYAGSTLFGYHTDRLGSVIALTDSSGQQIHREGYFPYGERWDKPDASSTQPGGTYFNGRLEDPVSGLLYLGARWYHPQLRRFVSIDPVDVQQGEIHSNNRYAYASNNPLRFVDPDGRAALDTMSGPEYGWETSNFKEMSRRAAEGTEGRALLGAMALGTVGGPLAAWAWGRHAMMELGLEFAFGVMNNQAGGPSYHELARSVSQQTGRNVMYDNQYLGRTDQGVTGFTRKGGGMDKMFKAGSRFHFETSGLHSLRGSFFRGAAAALYSKAGRLVGPISITDVEFSRTVFRMHRSNFYHNLKPRSRLGVLWSIISGR